jgi:hypothetical protein
MQPLPLPKMLEIMGHTKLCMADWKLRTREHFATIQPLLMNCIGEITTTYPLPHIPEFRLAVDRREDRFVAYPVGNWDHITDDLILTLEDVQLWSLDPVRVPPCLSSISNTISYTKQKRARIMEGYRSIILPSGKTMHLGKKFKRRAFLRSAIEWCRTNKTDTFFAQDVIENYNASFSSLNAKNKAIQSDRVIDDLFKGQKEEFLELFDVVDLAAAQFRLKVELEDR